MYLIGRRFRLVTDNRAVQILFSNNKAKIPARIERWVLRLMNFNFEIVHREDKQNIADYISRQPVEQAPKQAEISEAYINAMANYSVPKAMTKTEIVTATDVDQALVAQRKALRDESLSKAAGVCECTRIVIPESLQSRVVRIAHEGHLGESKPRRS